MNTENSNRHLNSNLGAAKYYFIGIGALIVILLGAAAVILFSPELRNNFIPSSKKQILEKSRLAGQIIDINQEDEYFTIEEEGTGEEFKINLPEGSEIKAGGSGSGTYRLSDLEIGQYIELINVKYTSSGGSPGNGSNGSSGGGGPGPGGGGNDNNGSNGGGGDNEVDDWEDIYVYFPFPAFSSKVLSIDSANQKLKVETIATPKKRFNVTVTDETIMVSLVLGDTQTIPKYGDIKVGWTLDIFSEEDPSENTELTAKGIFIKDK